MSNTTNHSRTVLNPQRDLHASIESLTGWVLPPKPQQSSSQYPIDGIASFCRLVTEIGVSFKPRTPEKPWALRAGEGASGMVECHRFVPGRQLGNFTAKATAAKNLRAHASDPTRTGEYYAVKRLNAYSVESNANQLNQLATELRILAHPPIENHPNILNLFGVSFLLAEPMLVFEDANCGSLSQFMKSPAIFTRQAFELKWNFCLDIAYGLEVLHNHGVIHGDIKDDNILIFCHDVDHYQQNRAVISDSTCRNFSAKLCDFGFSTILADEASTKVRSKAFTKTWAAPEAQSNEPITKEMMSKVDIYSAGVVFATIFLGGNHPFKAFAQTISSTTTEDSVLQILKAPNIKPLDLARYALAEQEFVTELQPSVSVNLGKWYCDWELERIYKVLECTYAENPENRLNSGRELVKHLQTIWQTRTWYSHREGCTGTVAEFEIANRRYQMEVFMDGHSEPPPRVPAKCSGPECAQTCWHVPSARKAYTIDMSRKFVLFTTTMTEHLERAIREDLIKKMASLDIPELSAQVGWGQRSLAKREAGDCAFQLSLMCAEGRGGPKNTILALNYLAQSILLGDMRAKLHHLALPAKMRRAVPTSPTMLMETIVESADTRELLSISRGSPLANLATELKPDAVRLELERLKASNLLELETKNTMSWALSAMTRLSRTQMEIIGKTNWKQKFIEIWELLQSVAVYQYFPNTTSSIGGMDLLSFACRYNDVAVEWFVNRYTAAQLIILFPKTFEETLPEVINVCMSCAHVERLQNILKFAKGNKHLTTCYLFPDAVHRQPSLISKYGEMFKAVGAGAALFETNPFGETAFDIALQYDFTDVMNYLLAQGESYDKYRLNPDFRIDQSRCSPLTLALGYKKKVDFMMALSPKPSLLVTESGMNVFHVLASKESVLGAETGVDLYGQLETFHLMDPSLVNSQAGRDKLAPFHLVALHYATKVGSFLKSHGANINVLDSKGRTPLDLLLNHGSASKECNFHPSATDSESKFICDYSLAGPAYWYKEHLLHASMLQEFKNWGAKKSSELETKPRKFDLAAFALSKDPLALVSTTSGATSRASPFKVSATTRTSGVNSFKLAYTTPISGVSSFNVADISATPGNSFKLAATGATSRASPFKVSSTTPTSGASPSKVSATGSILGFNPYLLASTTPISGVSSFKVADTSATSGNSFKLAATGATSRASPSKVSATTPVSGVSSYKLAAIGATSGTSPSRVSATTPTPDVNYFKRAATRSILGVSPYKLASTTPISGVSSFNVADISATSGSSFKLAATGAASGVSPYKLSSAGLQQPNAEDSLQSTKGNTLSPTNISTVTGEPKTETPYLSSVSTFHSIMKAERHRRGKSAGEASQVHSYTMAGKLAGINAIDEKVPRSMNSSAVNTAGAKRSTAKAKPVRRVQEVDDAPLSFMSQYMKSLDLKYVPESSRSMVSSLAASKEKKTSNGILSTGNGGRLGFLGIGVLAMVEHDYKKADHDEIDLVQGQYIANIEILVEGWWKGQNSKGEVGLFPGSYVKLVNV